jgi:hypothetical protein
MKRLNIAFSKVVFREIRVDFVQHISVSGNFSFRMVQRCAVHIDQGPKALVGRDDAFYRI